MKAKRFLAVLMVLAMVIVLYPVVAAAAVPITHDISTGPITIGDDGIYIITGTTTSNYIRVSAGASPDITLEKVNISSGGCAFLIENDSSGNVDLTLVGANTLISAANFAGLQKNGNNEIVGTLTIEGTGSLTATGGMWSAGIGGGDLGSGRNIIINGGTINSAGGAQGAGIGGGFLGTGSDIIINGGTVNATGGENGAGIGGGRQEVGSKITINGGTVNANGGEYGAGIGGGYARAGSDITINDGTVNAIGGQYAAGIGGGYYMGAASNITIGGGTVYAAGNFAAAIGVGFESDDPASNIMIVPAEGKQITVTAGNTDPLESIVGTFSSTTPYTRTDRYFHSYESFSNSSNCNIEESSVTITDNGNYNIYGTGKVTANSIILSSGVSPNITLANVNIINDYLTFVISDNSSGNVHINLVGNNSLQSRMYAGLIKNGSGVNVGTLTIEGSGSLRAVGGLDSAGIGATDGYSAGNIFINGGTIVAIGGDSAAGIGGGNSGSGSNININGGNVTATGGLFAAGIGGGDFASGYNININGGTVSASGGYGGAGIGGGYGGSVNIININGGNVTATGGSYAAGIGGGNGASGNNISIGGGIINAAGGVEATSIGAGTAGTAVPMMISPTAGKKITVMVGPAEPPTTVAGIFTSSTSYTAADRYLYAFEETIPVTYPVTVVNGTGGGDYAEGTTVNITADTA
ncbi:MAG: hypothetical protein PHV73_00640, partial [Eubacteriales bacterium]|nr:hypothetical protein [Eubacteriales bacterium]